MTLITNLDRATGIPLYLQVRLQIVSLIEQRGLKPGDALPSEPELRARFRVSRATVRHALAELERMGLIERHQGRGTFVALPRLERELPELTSFSEHLAEQGIRSASQLLDYQRLDPGQAPAVSYSEDEPDFFDYLPAQPLVRFVRLRLANAVPVGLHTTATTAAVAEAVGLTEVRLRGDPTFSFYSALEAAGYSLALAEEHLVARGAGQREAHLLGVTLGTPVMSVLRISGTRDGSPLEAVRAVYVGHKYDYVVHLERHDRRNRSSEPGGGKT
jgi:GntR family transcriptional regulator